MAAITKRMTKSGPSYRMQVKMKDKGSGKLNVYSTTWRPPAGLTQKQIEREVVINDNYASADYIDFPKRPAKEIDYMNDEDAKKILHGSRRLSGYTIQNGGDDPAADRHATW